MKKLSFLGAVAGLSLFFVQSLQAQGSNWHNYEIRFPKDAQANCTLPVPDTILVEEIAPCDLLAVSVQDEFFAASGDECYKIFRTYRVLNWCEYNGQSPPVIVSRDEDCDGLPGDEHVWVLVRPNGISYYDRDNNQSNGIPGAATKSSSCDGLTNPAGHWVNSVIKPAITSRGYWEYTQHIKVYDNVDPVITIAPHGPFCSYDSPTAADPVCEGPVAFGFSVSELCTPDDVTIKVFLDVFNNGVFPFDYNVRLNPNGTLSGDTNIFSITGSYPNYTLISTTPQGLPIGIHKFEIHAEDGCRNVTSTNVIIEVKDCKAPTPICYNGLALTLMPIDTDNDGEPDDGMAEVWATDFVASPLVDCTPPITYSLRRTGQAPDINRVSMVYTCDDYDATDCCEGTLQIIYVDAWDGAGNRDFCETYILLQNQAGVCPGPALPATISGFIHTEMGEPVQGINISLSGGMSQSAQTDANGHYRFDEIPMWSDYSWYPACTEDYANGVSTLDLIIIQRHILAVQLLDSPYKIIAADANNSQSVTLLDVILLQRLILGIIEELPNNDSWRFLPAGYVFPAPSNPWFEQFPEILTVHNCPSEVDDQNFIGIKIGDVNNSILTGLQPLEDRDAPGAFVVQTQDRFVEKGERVEVVFRSRDMERIQGFQFTLAFHPGLLLLEDIGNGVCADHDFGLHRAEEGLISMSWHEPIPARLRNSGDELFTLVFRAAASGMLSEALELNNRITKAEAYGVDDRILNMAMQFSADPASAAGVALYQNRPNPFKDQTAIEFFLPETAAITMTITDVQGRVLKVVQGEYARGYNQIRIEDDDLPAGVLQYTLTSGAYTATRKMVRTK